MTRSSPGRPIRLAILAALMIAKGVWTLLHRMVAAGVPILTQATLAASPKPIQLLEPTSAKTTVRAGKTAATGTRIIEIDTWTAILLSVIGDVGAGKVDLRGLVKGGGGAVDIVYDELNVAGARVQVVMVEVVVGAHGRRTRATV